MSATALVLTPSKGRTADARQRILPTLLPDNTVAADRRPRSNRPTLGA